MKIFFLSCILLCIAVIVPAQYTFQKTFGNSNYEKAYSVEPTNDGGFVLTGNTYAAGNGDIFLIRTNSQGDTVWTRTFFGGGEETAFSVKQTGNGGFILCGSTSSTVLAQYEALLIRTDSAGNMLWTKSYGLNNITRAESVIETTSGEFVITGHSYDTGSFILFLLMTDANGNPVWMKSYGDSATASYGNFIQQTNDGGFIISGWTNNNLPQSKDIYLLKTDFNGDSLWTRCWGGPYMDEAYCVRQTSDNGYIVVGLTYRYDSLGVVFTSDVLLSKTDAFGNLQWLKTYSDDGPDNGLAVVQNADGGYCIAGETNGANPEIFLIRTDSEGDTLWARNYGRMYQDAGLSMQAAQDGGFVISGFTDYILPNVQQSSYLIKTDANGNVGCNISASSMRVDPFIPVQSLPLMKKFIHTPLNEIPGISQSAFVDAYPVCLTVANETRDMYTMNVFPNPASATIFIDPGNMIKNGYIQIFNSTGILMHAGELKNTIRTEINIENFPAGIYYVNLYTGSGSHSQKFLVSD